MIKNGKKGILKKAILACAVMGVVMGPSIMANASIYDNNIGYSFKIEPYQHNTSVWEGRDRGEAGYEDWKVQMLSSSEADCSRYNITSYWLETFWGDNLCTDMNVCIADGAQYDRPSTDANNRTVYLTAENNNYNYETYYVKGYWDEETGTWYDSYRH